MNLVLQVYLSRDSSSVLILVAIQCLCARTGFSLLQNRNSKYKFTGCCTEGMLSRDKGARMPYIDLLLISKCLVFNVDRFDEILTLKFQPKNPNEK